MFRNKIISALKPSYYLKEATDIKKEFEDLLQELYKSKQDADKILFTRRAEKFYWEENEINLPPAINPPDEKINENNKLKFVKLYLVDNAAVLKKYKTAFIYISGNQQEAREISSICNMTDIVITAPMTDIYCMDYQGKGLNFIKDNNAFHSRTLEDDIQDQQKLILQIIRDDYNNIIIQGFSLGSHVAIWALYDLQTNKDTQTHLQFTPKELTSLNTITLISDRGYNDLSEYKIGGVKAAGFLLGSQEKIREALQDRKMAHPKKSPAEMILAMPNPIYIMTAKNDAIVNQSISLGIKVSQAPQIPKNLHIFMMEANGFDEVANSVNLPIKLDNIDTHNCSIKSLSLSGLPEVNGIQLIHSIINKKPVQKSAQHQQVIFIIALYNYDKSKKTKNPSKKKEAAAKLIKILSETPTKEKIKLISETYPMIFKSKRLGNLVNTILAYFEIQDQNKNRDDIEIQTEILSQKLQEYLNTKKHENQKSFFFKNPIKVETAAKMHALLLQPDEKDDHTNYCQMQTLIQENSAALHGSRLSDLANNMLMYYKVKAFNAGIHPNQVQKEEKNEKEEKESSLQISSKSGR